MASPRAAGAPERPRAQRSVILDADGLSKLARRDRVVRAMIEQEVRDAGSALVVPVIVTTQALMDVSADALRGILGAAQLAPVDFERAQEAAALMSSTGHLDAIDALVVAEGLRRVPSIVITSDRADIRQLLDAHPLGRRVAVWTA